MSLEPPEEAVYLQLFTPSDSESTPTLVKEWCSFQGSLEIGRAPRSKLLQAQSLTTPKFRSEQTKVMSSVHAKLSWLDGKPYLQDEGSTNGTFITKRGSTREKRLELNHLEPIENGDKITFGRSVTSSTQGLSGEPLVLTVSISTTSAVARPHIPPSTSPSEASPPPSSRRKGSTMDMEPTQAVTNYDPVAESEEEKNLSPFTLPSRESPLSPSPTKRGFGLSEEDLLAYSSHEEKERSDSEVQPGSPKLSPARLPSPVSPDEPRRPRPAGIIDSRSPLPYHDPYLDCLGIPARSASLESTSDTKPQIEHSAMDFDKRPVWFRIGNKVTSSFLEDDRGDADGASQASQLPSPQLSVCSSFEGDVVNDSASTTKAQLTHEEISDQLEVCEKLAEELREKVGGIAKSSKQPSPELEEPVEIPHDLKKPSPVDEDEDAEYWVDYEGDEAFSQVCETVSAYLVEEAEDGEEGERDEFGDEISVETSGDSGEASDARGEDEDDQAVALWTSSEDEEEEEKKEGVDNKRGSKVDFLNWPSSALPTLWTTKFAREEDLPNEVDTGGRELDYDPDLDACDSTGDPDLDCVDEDEEDSAQLEREELDDDEMDEDSVGDFKDWISSEAEEEGEEGDVPKTVDTSPDESQQDASIVPTTESCLIDDSLARNLFPPSPSPTHSRSISPSLKRRLSETEIEEQPDCSNVDPLAISSTVDHPSTRTTAPTPKRRRIASHFVTFTAGIVTGVVGAIAGLSAIGSVLED